MLIPVIESFRVIYDVYALDPQGMTEKRKQAITR